MLNQFAKLSRNHAITVITSNNLLFWRLYFRHTDITKSEQDHEIELVNK